MEITFSGMVKFLDLQGNNANYVIRRVQADVLVISSPKADSLTINYDGTMGVLTISTSVDCTVDIVVPISVKLL